MPANMQFARLEEAPEADEPREMDDISADAVLNNELPHEHTLWIPLAVLLSLFFLWGAANNLNDILIKQFKKAFQLGDLQSGLVQSFFYVGYFTFALPASAVATRYSFRVAIVCGLTLFAAGAMLFLPAASMFSYPMFLLALLVIGSGLAFLETSANPYVTQLGPPAEATWRLNFAAAFNPLGSVAGVALGRMVIFGNKELTEEETTQMTAAAAAEYYQREADRVCGPFAGVAASALFLIGLMCVFWKSFPTPATSTTTSSADVNLISGLRALLANRRYTAGVCSQFFYVGAQVGVWSFTIRYAQVNVPNTTEQQAADYLIVSLVIFIAGRFVTTVVIGCFPDNDHMLLLAYAVSAAVLSTAGVVVQSKLGLWCIVAVSFFMSTMFPTIFSLSLLSVPEHVKLAASLLVMAIVGGAVITAVMGLLSDQFGINIAFLVPAVCFAEVAAYAFFEKAAVTRSNIQT